MNIEGTGVSLQSSAPFAIVLRRRLDDYFQQRQISPKADRQMILKIVLGTGVWIGCFSAIFLLPLSGLQFFLVYFLGGLAQLFLLLNITHDSNHNAISKTRAVNRGLSLLMDACGVSSYMWRIIHHGGHHSCINVFGEDEAILGRRLLRFSPNAPSGRLYRYQYVYAPFLYCFFSLDYILLKDFEYFFFPREARLRQISHGWEDYLLLICGKVFYLAYMLVLPMLAGYSLWLVILTFLAVHMVAGFVSVVVFQTSHVIEESVFPASRTEFSLFVFHIFATTADYATANPVVSFFAGGLNHHIVHHLCPHVCHTHYPRLTPIVKATAAEFQIPYREHPTIREAFQKHLLLLKELGAAS